ncbi:hypothetical protein [Providencia sp. Me31A]|uniref:hypothetical protein n=1 Tax=Providencia sp. Me31A TaxID=3392637 RepID=UPI003D2C65EB
MEQKQSIWSVIAIIVPLTSLFIFISPYLLFTYLKILNAENFFPFLLNETYLFPYLLFVSSFLFLVFIIVYILPTLLYGLIQKPINKVNIKGKKKNVYFVKRINFLVASLSAPLLVYSSITLDINNGTTGILVQIIISMLISFFILAINLKYTLRMIKKIKTRYFILLISPLASIVLIYFFETGRTQASVIISFISVLFLMLVISLIFQGNNRIITKCNEDRVIMLFIISMMIVITAFGMVFFISPNVIENKYNNNYFFDFIKLYLFLCFLPNVILYIISKENTYVRLSFISGYLTLLFMFTNIVDIIAYRSFNSMHFINETKLNVNKWYSPKNPIPIKNEIYNGTVFNAFQSLNYSLLCERKNDQFTISDIHFRSLNKPPITNDNFFCIYIENKDINLISSTKKTKDE